MPRTAKAATIAAAMALTAAGAAEAATYKAKLSPLNAGVDGQNLDVSGKAFVHYDGGDMLKVSINATGLEPNQAHAQHIHGLTGGDSRTPTLADDAAGDNDGVIELVDGVPAYGPVILNLFDGASFPTVGSDGVLSFSQTYDLSSAPFADGFGPEDLLPLDFREIVLHGGTLGAVGFDAGRLPVEEADGTPGYKPFLPVAAGELAPVPLPAAGWLLLAGVGGLIGFGRRRA